MGLSTMDPLICPTEWTDFNLNALYNGIGNTGLTVTGMSANRAEFTQVRHCPVQGSNLITHGKNSVPSATTGEGGEVTPYHLL